MDITMACATLRRCNEALLMGAAVEVAPLDAAAAVNELKRYLERAKFDGKPIDELSISASLLLTPQGMRWVMPFVYSAESMEATRRRLQHG